MKCILLILISAVAFSQESEITRLRAAHDAELVAVEAKYIQPIIDYRDRTFAKIELTKLEQDPKQSELLVSREKEHYVNNYNAFNEVVTSKESAKDKVQRLFNYVNHLESSSQRLQALGFKMKAPPLANPVETVESKPKKKITATLADGTKIE